ncbi:hypothetical protein ACJJTC_013235 [Scirpophaga incertulas]
MASGLIQFAFVLASGIINIMPNEVGAGQLVYIYIYICYVIKNNFDEPSRNLCWYRQGLGLRHQPTLNARVGGGRASRTHARAATYVKMSKGKPREAWMPRAQYLYTAGHH